MQSGQLYGFTYDALDRIDVTTFGYLPGAVSVTLDHNFDRYGNRDQLTLNDGALAVHGYPYNILNQLGTVSLPGGQSLSMTYYQDYDRPKQLSYLSGITSDYSYEDNGPVKQILTQTSGSTVLDQLDYTYDNVLNVDTMNSSRDNGLHDFAYDGLDHLTQAIHPILGTEDFAYDKVGNREDTTDPSLYVYDANHRITLSPGIATYGYDGDGNMTSKDAVIHGYNMDSQLSTYDDGADIASYTYDSYGRRIKKTVNGTDTWFLWDGPNVLAEYDSAGVRQKRYAYLPGDYTPIQVEDAHGIYDVHRDHLQTARFLTNSNQIIVWSADRTAFGETTTNEDLDGDGISITFNLRFPGQYFDEESGLHYNYYRDYDPSTGRYIQSDPIGLRAGVNTYGYAYQNPQYWVDPYGLYCLSDAQIQAIASAIGGGVGGAFSGAVVGVTAGGGVGAVVGGIIGGVRGAGIGFASGSIGGIGGGAAVDGATENSGARGRGRSAAAGAVGGAIGEAVGGTGGAAIGGAIGGALGGGNPIGGAIGGAAGAAAAEALKAGNDCPDDCSQ